VSDDVARDVTRRINRGRSHSYELDGAPVISVTKAIGEGYPKPGLVGWAADESGKYVVNHWEELAEMPLADRYKVVRDARFAMQRAATVRGTKVHELAQQLAAGQEVEVADEYVGHVDAYLLFVQQWRPRELLVEAPVFSRELRYAGTLDLIADLADGHRWLLDWKTSKGEPYPEAALQLAAYRYADFALVDDEEIELADYRIERCGVVWLRADGYDLIEIEADEEAMIAFRAAMWIAHFRATPRDRWVGSMLEPPAFEATA
jgi:PD-(D/E)XK nuclease superfamily